MNWVTGTALDDREFCVVLSTQSQCARERRPGWSGEINRTKNARKLKNYECVLCPDEKRGARVPQQLRTQRQRLQSFRLVAPISFKADRLRLVCLALSTAPARLR